MKNSEITLSAYAIDMTLLKVFDCIGKCEDYKKASDAYYDLERYIWRQAPTALVKKFIQIDETKAKKLMTRLYKSRYCYDGRVKAFKAFFRWKDNNC